MLGSSRTQNPAGSQQVLVCLAGRLGPTGDDQLIRVQSSRGLTTPRAEYWEEVKSYQASPEHPERTEGLCCIVLCCCGLRDTVAKKKLV